MIKSEVVYTWFDENSAAHETNRIERAVEHCSGEYFTRRERLYNNYGCLIGTTYIRIYKNALQKAA